MSPTLKSNRIKKSDLKTDTTYLLCPDPECELFKDDSGITPCEYDCPRQDELVKIIACERCNAMMELPGDDDVLPCKYHNCFDGDYAINDQQRMSGKYHRIFERPE